MITYIPRERLEPHPDNPRQELGDLTELAASIKKQGLLQNLTVVPSPDNLGRYRIVIGRRRFAASGLAGLGELPCIIDEKMTYPEQIAVMMSENIQRNDLTIAEKAGGVQMMMELGMDTSEIAGNTGISDTTVRRYAKLGKLGASGLRQAEQRGATLMQLSEICEIEDEALRGEALEKAGTSEYGRVLYRVRVARARRARLPLIGRALAAFASEIDKEDYGRHIWRECFDFVSDDCVSKANAFKPAKGKVYVFLVREFDVVLYEEREQLDDAKAQAKRVAAQRLRARLDHEEAIAVSFREMRDAFMRERLSLRGREETARRFVLWVLTRSEFLGAARVGGSFDYCCLPRRENKGCADTLEIDDDELSQIPERETLRALVLVAYDRISGRNPRAIDSCGKPAAGATLEGLYRHMEALGYPVSAEARAWLDGTHECFTYPHDAAGVA